MGNWSNERQHQKVINGTEYTAQYLGAKFYFDTIQQCKDNDTIKRYELSKILFDKILVSPKITIDDLDLEEYEAVVSFLLEVFEGGKEKSKARLNHEVKREWACWRILASDVYSLTYDEVFNQMTLNEIMKANIVLDRIMEQLKR